VAGCPAKGGCPLSTPCPRAGCSARILVPSRQFCPHHSMPISVSDDMTLWQFFDSFWWKGYWGDFMKAGYFSDLSGHHPP
jgi:hypothetical protein